MTTRLSTIRKTIVPIVNHHLKNNRPQNVQRNQPSFHLMTMIPKSVMLKLVMLVLLKFHQPMFHQMIHHQTIVLTRNRRHQRMKPSIERRNGKNQPSSQRRLLQLQHRGLPKNRQKPIFESLLAATGHRHYWQASRFRESMINSGERRQWRMAVRWQITRMGMSLGTMASVPGRAKNYSQLVENDSNTKRRNESVLSTVSLEEEAK
mmetsp:Transcript_16818/g.19373  ORF Transcript_16818/g.19373 Transcript_16818/m.19373 type:complete len:206 (+) Transcript_16818:1985-2602(+)